MAAFKTEQSVQYGSKVLTINAVTYVADNVTINRTSKTILRTSELDEPSGQVSYKGEPDTGTAQIQLASGATAIPAQGDTFTSNLGLGSETYYLTDISIPYTKDGETKVNITFRESLA